MPSVEVGLGFGFVVEVDVVLEEEDLESEKPLIAILGGGIESSFAGDIFA